MKKITLLSLIYFFVSCGNENKKSARQITYESETKPSVERGEALFNAAGNCFACHKEDQKIIAPSLVEIAKIYKTTNADMVQFLKGKGKPVVDPSQYETMKTNFAITQGMSDEELESLEAYVMSFAK